MVWGSFKLPPEAGTVVVDAVEVRADREHRGAYKAGQREPHDHYAPTPWWPW